MADNTLSIASVKALVDESHAVIFDNDGTIVDSMPPHLIAWQIATKAHGIVFTEERFYALGGMPAGEIVQLLCREQGITDVALDDLLTLKANALSALLKQVKRVDVVVELLEYAQAKGLPIAVASGGHREDVLGTLKVCDIDTSKFVTIVTTEDVVNGKPHPETFLLAARRLGVDPALCLGFEDADKGLEALAAAGIKSVDVRRMEGYPLPQCLRT